MVFRSIQIDYKSIKTNAPIKETFHFFNILNNLQLISIFYKLNFHQCRLKKIYSEKIINSNPIL